MLLEVGENFEAITECHDTLGYIDVNVTIKARTGSRDRAGRQCDTISSPCPESTSMAGILVGIVEQRLFDYNQFRWRQEGNSGANYTCLPGSREQ
jgi:hypothetical protein